MMELNTDIFPAQPKLLIVDDVPANLKVLLAALSQEFDVMVANSGPQGLELAAKSQPELIMLDISMPGMDGLQACQILKSDPALKHIPVVFATALTDAAHETKGLMLGAADFINKPFRIEVVRMRIRNIIDRQRLAKLIELKNKELELSARLDNLTKLPNRVMLEDRLNVAMTQAQRNRQLMALIFVDLDGFKAVNDTHGHLAGDHLLKALAVRLQDCVRQGDTVARLGGDEFVVLVNQLKDQSDCLFLLERMLQAMGTPVSFDLATLQVSASLGVTFYPQSETDALDAKGLLDQADQAMYKAKRAGKNGFAFYGSAPPRSLQQRSWTHQDLEHALADGSMELVFSPELDLHSGRIMAMEALLRWHLPNGDTLGPAHFLETLQHHPLSIRIGQWVLRQALAHQQTWLTQGHDITVVVNISCHHFATSEFPDELQAMLADLPNCQPDKLKLDLCEVSQADPFSATYRSLLRCAELGVQFALDDFGTGQSSLTYLRHAPVQQIKVDPVLQPVGLDAPAQRQVLLKLVDLLKTMGFSVLAEGVEKPEQLTEVQALGFDGAQGLAIHKHLSAADVPAFLASWKGPANADLGP
jgi:diguanylate cyclase (GGDEF)-like protein